MEKSEKIKEILELAGIPEVENFLFAALEEAKIKFNSQIQEYRNTKDKTRKDNKEEIHLPDLNKFSPEKSYFFDLTRIENAPDDSTNRWVVDTFKFKDDPGIVNLIFAEFFKKIDHLEINPQKIKIDTIQPQPGIAFEIHHYKTGQTHVGGFVKIYHQEEKKSGDDSTVIRTSRKYNEMDKENMYLKIKQLMEENPEARKHIFLYYDMVQKAKEQS